MTINNPYDRLKTHKLSFNSLIIFEDNDLLVINKPVGISSLSERNVPNSGILELARKEYPNIRLCHRLDKFTSGVLIFAKTFEAYRNIAIQFQKRKVKKVYTALANNSRLLEAYEIHAPVMEPIKGVGRIDFEKGKKSTTLVSTLKQYRHFTYIRCEPLTGRTHQIRLHLAYIQCPIVGDLLYGGKDMYLSEMKRKYKQSEESDELPLNIGFVLHSASLTLLHPRTNEEIIFEAPENKNFQTCLKYLEKFDNYE